ncbi:cynS [Malassezia furfur]|nr:cynS [Malassezia furfur]
MPTQEEASKLQGLLRIRDSISHYLGPARFTPRRGGLDPVPPSEPCLYRLYEVFMCGDSVMSAVDLRVHVDKIQGPDGDRVKITLDGAFVPYRSW